MTAAEMTAPRTDAPLTPMSLLDKAVAAGIDPDQLGKLLDLQERWEKSRAAEAFAAALAGFQSDCGPVFKSRRATGEKLKFDYAAYDDVMRQAAPHMSRWGIVPTFDTKHVTEPGAASGRIIEVTCRVRVGAHMEQTTVTVPVPVGAVNQAQLMAQAVTYGKRYSLCAALNIVVTDEDRDATDLFEAVEPAELAEVRRLIAERNVNVEAFLEWCQVDALEKMPRAKFPTAVAALKKAHGRNGGAS